MDQPYNSCELTVEEPFDGTVGSSNYFATRSCFGNIDGINLFLRI